MLGGTGVRGAAGRAPAGSVPEVMAPNASSAVRQRKMVRGRQRFVIVPTPWDRSGQQVDQPTGHEDYVPRARFVQESADISAFQGEGQGALPPRAGGHG